MNESEIKQPTLSIGRAYTAEEAAAFLGLNVRTFNERVREGMLFPIWPSGERRYSGYAIARLLGWPLTDDPLDYVPAPPPGMSLDDEVTVRATLRELIGRTEEMEIIR